MLGSAPIVEEKGMEGGDAICKGSHILNYSMSRWIRLTLEDRRKRNIRSVDRVSCHDRRGRGIVASDSRTTVCGPDRLLAGMSGRRGSGGHS